MLRFAFDTIRSIKNSPRWISGAQTMKAAPDWGVYILLAMSCFCLNNPHMQVLFFFCFRSKPLSEMPFHCDFKTRLYISTLPAVNQQTLFLLLNTVKKKKTGSVWSAACQTTGLWQISYLIKHNNTLSFQSFVILEGSFTSGADKYPPTAPVSRGLNIYTLKCIYMKQKSHKPSLALRKALWPSYTLRSGLWCTAIALLLHFTLIWTAISCWRAKKRDTGNKVTHYNEVSLFTEAVWFPTDSVDNESADTDCTTSQEVIILRRNLACDLRVMSVMSAEFKGKQPRGLTKNCW